MKFLGFDLLTINRNGFKILSFKMERDKKNIRSDLNGFIKEEFYRSAFGIIVNKYFIMIHVLFFMKQFNLKKK